MEAQVLYSIVKQLLTPGKGILASDESTSSANKNLEKINVKGTLENRRRYRELFIGTPEIGKYLTGIILFDETLRQADSNRILFRDILRKEKVLIGIKVDKGTTQLPFFPNETITLGLDELSERVKEYKELGAKFAKWRAVFEITNATPTDEALEANSLALAHYAAICQENGLVPIVEPEVLYKGNHSLDEAQKITTKVLKKVFYDLIRFKVDLPGLILKTSMVLAGKEHHTQSTPMEVATATIYTLKAAVPKNVGGIVFLSGGQTPQQATINFNEITKFEPLPWEVAFSFLRALEGPPAEAWAGKDANLENARKVFITKLIQNTAADKGTYNG